MRKSFKVATPREVYETDNLICDFALKISGDSMEPNIKDGNPNR